MAKTKKTAKSKAKTEKITTKPANMPSDEAFTFQPLVPDTGSNTAGMTGQKKEWFENEDFWKNYGHLF